MDLSVFSHVGAPVCTIFAFLLLSWFTVLPAHRASAVAAVPRGAVLRLSSTWPRGMHCRTAISTTVTSRRRTDSVADPASSIRRTDRQHCLVAAPTGESMGTKKAVPGPFSSSSSMRGSSETAAISMV